MKICRIAFLCAFLTSCSIAPEKASYDNSERLRWKEAAEKGDKDAQYQLGNAYCCGDKGGFWDTQEALKWWCKAAAQGQKEAITAISHVKGNCNL